jgi:hypothetical protein
MVASPMPESGDGKSTESPCLNCAPFTRTVATLTGSSPSCVALATPFESTCNEVGCPRRYRSRKAELAVSGNVPSASCCRTAGYGSLSELELPFEQALVAPLADDPGVATEIVPVGLSDEPEVGWAKLTVVGSRLGPFE